MSDTRGDKPSDDPDVKATKAAPSIDVPAPADPARVTRAGDPLTIQRRTIKDPTDAAFWDAKFDELVDGGTAKLKVWKLCYSDADEAPEWRAIDAMV